MNTEVKEKKSFNDHRSNVELEELQKKFAPLLMEQRQLLKKVGATDLLSFEVALNERTQFVKASLSAEALGYENEYYRLTELERILEGRLKDEDVSTDGKLKLKKIKEIKEKHTTYYTEQELEALKLIENAIVSYNKIPYQYKAKVIIDNRGQMIMNPFNRL